MKTIRFFRLLVLRVLILAALAMAWSYLTEFITTTTGFFGDVLEDRGYGYSRLIWGWRHYVWNVMGGVLVIISLVRIGVWGDWYWTQVNRHDDVDLKSDENKLF